jgi:hypothetical protein
MVTRKKLYCAEALRMSRKCQDMLPVADTAKARKTIKDVIRATKMLICALTPAEELKATEKILFSTKDLNALKLIIDKLVDIPMPIDELLNDLLKANDVSDWSAWMVAQEQLRYWLADIEPRILFSNVKEQRLHEAITRTRNMLLPGLRNIFFERDEKLRRQLISDYADETASTIVQLGMSGVSELLDFTTSAIPPIVRRSYDMLIIHLQESNPTFESLAASIILLEFSFKHSLDVGVYHNR